MKFARLSILGASLVIAACGGGGDGELIGAGDNSAGTLEIDGSNATAAVRVSYEAATDAGNLAGLGGGAGFSAGVPGSSAIAVQASDATGRVLDVVSQIPFGPEVQFCNGVDDTDGTITLSGDIQVPGTFTQGDTFNIAYEMCDQGTGEVVDGLIELTVGDFTGDLLTGLYMIAMDAVITDLQVTTAADTVTGNGDSTVTLDTTQSPFVTAGVSGTSLTMDSNANSETLSNYSSSQTFDGNQFPPEYTLGASGTLDSTQLTGVVVYATSPDFTGSGENYPHAGVLTVEGNASMARLVAVDSTDVRIEIDTNGDGTVDETINTTWDALVNPD